MAKIGAFVGQRIFCCKWYNMILERYCEYLDQKGDKQATIEWNRQKLLIFKNWLCSLPAWERSKPVNSKLITAYLDYRRQSVTQNTIAGDYRALKAMFAWAFKEGYFLSNPCDGMRPVKAEPCHQAPFSPNELAKIFNAIPDDSWIGKRNIAIIVFLVDTGVRVTALTKIKDAEMDLVTRRVYVTDKYSKKRWLSWGNRTQQALVDYYESRPNITACDRFFVSDKLKALTRYGIYQMFQKVLKTAGVPKRKVHMLRASFACQFLIAGGPERQWQLQLAMGLADDSQIRNVYGRTVMDDLTLTAMRELSPADRIPALPPP